MSDDQKIAKFMGEPLTFTHDTGFGTEERTFSYDGYYDEWNELMPVVEKIESLGFSFFIHNDGAYLRRTHYKGNFPDIGNLGESKIEATNKTALAFIDWYETQKV